MQILVQKVRDEAPGYCMSNKFPGDVGIADPTTPLWVAMVVDATSQVWEFLAAPTSLFSDFSPVSVCFDITFYFESTLGFSMLPTAEWKVWRFSCIFPLRCWYSIAMASSLYCSLASLLLYYIALLIYLSVNFRLWLFSFLILLWPFLSFALSGSWHSLQMPWLTPCPNCLPAASKTFLWKEQRNWAQETAAPVLPLLLLGDTRQRCYFPGLLTYGYRVWIAVSWVLFSTKMSGVIFMWGRKGRLGRKQAWSDDVGVDGCPHLVFLF